MAKIETLKIAWSHEPGYVTINKSDFDPSEHDIYAPVPDPSLLTREQRQSELDAMDWRDVKAIAEEYEITKPEGGSWDDAIPLILDHEFGVPDA